LKELKEKGELIVMLQREALDITSTKSCFNDDSPPGLVVV
jgi:hypothetical protein